MDERTCKTCGETKPLSEMTRNASTSSGYDSRCKACAREWQRRYRIEHRNRVIAGQRRSREANRDVIVQRQRDNYAANRSHILEQGRTWRAANKDKKSAQARRYRATHPGKDNERRRVWGLANPELVIESNRRYYQANADRYRENARQWLARNPGKAAEYARRWLEAHPEEARDRARTRKAKLNGLSTAGTKSLIQAKMEYWGDQCWMCGGPFEHIDHVKPVSRGGPHLLSNLRPACYSCNIRKNARWPFPTAKRTHPDTPELLFSY